MAMAHEHHRKWKIHMHLGDHRSKIGTENFDGFLSMLFSAESAARLLSPLPFQGRGEALCLHFTFVFCLLSFALPVGKHGSIIYLFLVWLPGAAFSRILERVNEKVQYHPAQDRHRIVGSRKTPPCCEDEDMSLQAGERYRYRSESS